MNTSAVGVDRASWLYQQRLPVVPSSTILTDDRDKGLGDTSNSSADPQLREVFRDFAAQTLFSHMLRSMRQTLGKPAYFHGGKFEEIFQAELDRLIVEKAARKSGESWTDSMFRLFSLQIR